MPITSTGGDGGATASPQRAWKFWSLYSTDASIALTNTTTASILPVVGTFPEDNLSDILVMFYGSSNGPSVFHVNTIPALGSTVASVKRTMYINTGIFELRVVFPAGTYNAGEQIRVRSSSSNDIFGLNTEMFTLAPAS